MNTFFSGMILIVMSTGAMIVHVGISLLLFAGCGRSGQSSNTSDQAFPSCNAKASDPDGDGWGWEDGRSCKVTPRCNETASDPDGDGWGWENGESCKIDRSDAQAEIPRCKSKQSDPDGDGWGWENDKSCKVASESTWIPNCTSNEADPDGDGWGWENNRSCKAWRRGFRLSEAKLIDPSGKEFVARGVNLPMAYHREKSLSSLQRIKDLGFNTVRIVWCADTKNDAVARCDPNYHMHSPSVLRHLLGSLRDLKLIAVLNLQNSTGSDRVQDLHAMADYLLKPDVKDILNEYSDTLLINVANEWYGTWNRNDTYLDGYKQVIPKLRNGGIGHVLLVDGPGYGQDAVGIKHFASSISQLDPNLLISAHVYDAYNESTLRDLFGFVRREKIPFIVGEYGCLGESPCTALFEEAENSSRKVGTIAWTYSGDENAGLDLVQSSDWKTLTSYGHRVVYGWQGISQTSRQACFFGGC